MAGKRDAAHFHDLALVPAKQWRLRRKTCDWLFACVYTPAHKFPLAGRGRDVPQFRRVRSRKPRIRNLHATSMIKKIGSGRVEFGRRYGLERAVVHRATPPRSAATISKKRQRSCGHHTPRTSTGTSASHIGTVIQALTLTVLSVPRVSAVGRVSKYMARKWLRKPVKITISSSNITITAQAFTLAMPARINVSSLRKRPNGGAPVIATAPASHSAPVTGKRVHTSRISPMSLVPNTRITLPAPKNMSDLFSEWLSM